MSLSERDRAILDFERGWWKHAGSKQRAIQLLFGLSSSQYYRLLGRVIDDPDAPAHDPLTVKRLRRDRARRRQLRFEGHRVRPGRR
jgi:hypothetical protein